MTARDRKAAARKGVSLPRLMRMELAAEYLAVSLRHVEKLREVGELEGLDVSMPGARRPSWRVTFRSVRDFFDRRSTRARVARSLSVARGRPGERA